jgi:hypothetical protein
LIAFYIIPNVDQSCYACPNEHITDSYHLDLEY